MKINYNQLPKFVESLDIMATSTRFVAYLFYFFLFEPLTPEYCTLKKSGDISCDVSTC